MSTAFFELLLEWAAKQPSGGHFDDDKTQIWIVGSRENGVHTTNEFCVKRIAVYAEGEWKTRQHGSSKRSTIALRAFKTRDKNLRYIRRHGRKKWKRDANYHCRLLTETTREARFFRDD
jgi:hypothetical protein